MINYSELEKKIKEKLIHEINAITISKFELDEIIQEYNYEDGFERLVDEYILQTDYLVGYIAEIIADYIEDCEDEE